MKYFKLLFTTIVFALVMLPLSSLAQKQAGKNPGKRQVAFNQVMALKNSVLLVRLSTGDNQIQALEKAGHTARAEQIKQHHKHKNLDVMIAFKENFRFCPVYFFYSTDVREVKSGNTNGLLVNGNLERDPGILMDKDTFFIAAIGDIYIETFNSLMEGLGVYDQQMNLLADPFPHFIRKHFSFFFYSRSEQRQVEVFSRKLQKLYFKAYKSVTG